MTRRITFAGALGYGDYQVSADVQLITIDRSEHGEFQPHRDVLPGSLLALSPVSLSCARQYGEAVRSSRPYGIRTLPWAAGEAARTLDEICDAAMLPLLKEADGYRFHPDRDLEAWMLPVTEISALTYLLTPAGDWMEAS